MNKLVLYKSISLTWKSIISVLLIFYKRNRLYMSLKLTQCSDLCETLLPSSVCLEKLDVHIKGLTDFQAAVTSTCSETSCSTQDVRKICCCVS